MGIILTVGFRCKEAWQAIYDEKFELASQKCEEVESLVSFLPVSANERAAACYYSVHSIRGIVKAKNGDLEGASKLLFAASRHLVRSPVNLTFGPNLLLPNILLKAGIIIPVVDFLRSCEDVWPLGKHQIKIWLNEIGDGKRPTLEAGGY
jgi:hypothetical protein